MEEFSKLLLHWYSIHKRTMPWRDVKDPYKVWVSEVMLQQTRVETVIDYYTRWMLRFPDLAALAAAKQEEVLKVWEGLGYYSRGRKLHEAAQVVIRDHGGKIPNEPEVLISLPGIGPYTAAAIGSFAFDKDTFPVDGNINRVFARVFGIERPLGSKEFSGEIETRRARVFPIGRSADFNQALMDLGAMVCKPVKPSCPECPLVSVCKSTSDPERLPIKVEKATPPTVTKIGAAFIDQGKTLVIQRSESGLLGGLWEFPNRDVESNAGSEGSLQDLIGSYGIQPSDKIFLLRIKHAYTHFKVIEDVYAIEIKQPPEKISEGCWVFIHELDKLPMGKIDRSIADQLNKI